MEYRTYRRENGLRAALAVFLFLFCLLCAQRAEAGGTVSYTVQNGVLTAVTGETSGVVLTVPSIVDGQTITAIGESAFSGTAFSSVSLPETVLSIGRLAFEGCTNLKTVTLPSSLERLDYGVFRGCTALTSIALPASLNYMDAYVFENCTSLQRIKIPSGVTELEYGTFRGCTALTSVTLPSGLTFIECETFRGCSSLTTLTIPAGVTTVQYDTFGDCSKLKTLQFLADDIYIDFYAFRNCTALETIIGPIRGMEIYAFIGSEQLKSIELSENMKSIPQELMAYRDLIMTVGQGSHLEEQLISHGHPYRIRETGEVYNVVNSTATTVSAKVDDIVEALIRPGMSDYQKALALHDWLTRNASYDYSYSNYSASGVLLKGKGVCQSYALAYELLMDEVGIPNCLEYGDDHVWNMIKLDGDWYHVDATWDDPTSNIPHAECWDFFCVSNYALQGVESHECYNKPQIATNYKYYYAYRNGELDDMLEECREKIAGQLKAGLLSFQITLDSFEVPPFTYGINERTAVMAIRDQGVSVDGALVMPEIEYDFDTATLTVSLAAAEPELVLPDALKEIGAEAFAGCGARVIGIPAGTVSIGARAFADCDSLWQIHIPSSVNTIDDTAFEGVGWVMICGKKGSAAELFAKAHGFAFVPV